jgi:hypothetical protein
MSLTFPSGMIFAQTYTIMRGAMRKIPGITFLLTIMLVLGLAAELSAGQIYKWVDEDGVVSYSNVAPPEDETDVGVTEETLPDESASDDEKAVASPSAAGNADPPAETVAAKTKEAAPVDDSVAARVRAAHNNKGKPGQPAPEEKKLTAEEMAKLEETSKDEHIKPKPLRKRYLDQRIQDTEESIVEIHKMLEKRPKDESLRKTLTLKKQYLRKYKQAVETGNY